MKNKIVLIVGILSLIVIGIVCYYVFYYRLLTTIYLDINPSLEIKIKNDIVKSVKAINDDGNDVIEKDFKGSKVNDVIEKIVINSIEKGYANDEMVDMLIYSDEKEYKIYELKDKVENSLKNKNIICDFIVVENVSKEDIKEAKKNNITPSKMSYINSIDKEEVEDNLINKSVNEIKETKDVGLYCDKDYVLEGTVCVKEIKRFKAKYDNRCPNGYSEYEGKCYADTMILDKDEWKCNAPLKYDGEKCTYSEVIDVQPQYECEIGELYKKGDLFQIGGIKNANKYYCVDKSTGKKPVLRCLNNKGHIMINGKCYNGPAPLINGGCPGKDVKRNGKCYSLDNEDQWECPDGQIYMKSREGVPDLCPDTFTYRTPKIVGYSCPEGYILEDKKCTLTRNEEGFREKYCPSGYTLIEDRMCINKNKTTEKVSGYYCEEREASLVNDECIIYEKKEAMHY